MLCVMVSSSAYFLNKDIPSGQKGHMFHVSCSSHLTEVKDACHVVVSSLTVQIGIRHRKIDNLNMPHFSQHEAMSLSQYTGKSVSFMIWQSRGRKCHSHGMLHARYQARVCLVVIGLPWMNVMCMPSNTNLDCQVQYSRLQYLGRFSLNWWSLAGQWQLHVEATDSFVGGNSYRTDYLSGRLEGICGVVWKRLYPEKDTTGPRDCTSLSRVSLFSDFAVCPFLQTLHICSYLLSSVLSLAIKYLCGAATAHFFHLTHDNWSR